VLKLEAYRKAEQRLPDRYEAWQIFGAGLDNLGRDGRPVALPLRDPAHNEILVRVDAVGLCQSDIKIIHQGSKHARLRGRNLAKDPTVLGHECAVTVVKVGRNWLDHFKIGERFIVQADIYYQGVNYAFGYLIPGGLGQYCYLDERALAGDEGCYLLPVKSNTGYSECALAEPWACVEMSYSSTGRLAPGGGMLLITADDSETWKTSYPEARFLPRNLAGFGDETFDDIIISSPTPELVGALAPRLRKGGAMFLLGTPGTPGGVLLDLGRIHYEGVRFYGGGPDVESVGQVNARHDLLPGGVAWFIGAGGPMGQMHVQRALEIDDHPRRVVISDLDPGRLAHIQHRFCELAEQNGIELHTLATTDFASQQAMDDALRSLAPDGYTDVVLLAPVASLVSHAVGFAADRAVINIFAGLAIGTSAVVPLSALCRGIKLIGTSGSRISDLRKVLQMVESHKLNTDFSVAAIGGLHAVREGLEGVSTARFPGKTVIYPQIRELPLMSTQEIPERIPELKDKLGPHGSWTKEAEAALLDKCL
jgi:threonine dehydrogenase-like Zn-dependent dehydrogenase